MSQGLGFRLDHAILMMSEHLDGDDDVQDVAHVAEAAGGSGGCPW